ncbi:MAG TPA: DNA repair protein RecN [Caulobacteraceae bacterium]
MLLGLDIRDLVLIERLDLVFGEGLTALTGETGAGKSIILDALGLATGGRAEACLVRQGARQAIATALFAPAADHLVWALLDEKGVARDPQGDLVLRRTIAADGRSRAFVNDQAVGVGLLRELGAALVEVHGQHETIGLLDARRHGGLLDAYAGCGARLGACAEAWRVWRAADDRDAALRADQTRAAAENDDLAERLGELDRLAPREGEEEGLAAERRLLGSAEKTLADVASARDALGSNDLAGRAAGGLRALERASERLRTAGAADDGRPMRLLVSAREAAQRALVELAEAAAAVDAAAAAFDFEPNRLEKAEERLFALRAMARKLAVPVAELPLEHLRVAQRLAGIEGASAELAHAVAATAAARQAYVSAAASLSAIRCTAARRLTAAVQAELPPLKLDKAKFRVVVDHDPDARAGPLGADRIEFEISTVPGSPFTPLGGIASGGELARFSLAIKACLAPGRRGVQPVLIFDEVDQGVGGAVADAVGVRLKRLAAAAQVLVVTHSPQVAARADAHWRVDRVAEGARTRTEVEVLTPLPREEEIARMLSGARISDAARAAARALIHA